VNRGFGEMFPALFGRRRAQLIMTGEEISIVACRLMGRPPGKRTPPSICSRRGEGARGDRPGVFFFQLNPRRSACWTKSTRRSMTLTPNASAIWSKKMSQQTQFLFISHNKITMEMAHQLIASPCRNEACRGSWQWTSRSIEAAGRTRRRLTMSELQVGLLGVAAVVVAVVFLYNKWQERRTGTRPRRDLLRNVKTC